MKSWIKCTITIPSSHQDLLIGQLVQAGLSGFVQESDFIDCYAERRMWYAGVSQLSLDVIKRFGAEFPELDLRTTTADVVNRNWNAVWEKNAGIVNATDRIVIKPSWKKLRKQDRGKIVVHIDPKMSFGTGHHESTRLCLRLLEYYLRKGNSVGDFGTGTGVLAIAAAKLGAARVLAVDNDEWSFENAAENVQRNKSGKRVTVRRGSIAAMGNRPFDIVVANIDLPTITKFLTRLLRLTRAKGVLILSGLLLTDLVPLLKLLQRRAITPLLLVDEAEWIGIALQRS